MHLRPIREKTTRVYRAVDPETGEMPTNAGSYPTWRETEHLSLDKIKAACAKYWPDAVLEVQETIVKEWKRV